MNLLVPAGQAVGWGSSLRAPAHHFQIDNAIKRATMVGRRGEMPLVPPYTENADWHVSDAPKVVSRAEICYPRKFTADSRTLRSALRLVGTVLVLRKEFIRRRLCGLLTVGWNGPRGFPLLGGQDLQGQASWR